MRTLWTKVVAVAILSCLVFSSVTLAGVPNPVSGTAEVTQGLAQDTVHYGLLGLIARLVLIPVKVVEWVLTGSRGLKGLHNVATRPYEGP